MPLRAAPAALRSTAARRRAAHVAFSVARRRSVFVSGLLQIASRGEGANTSRRFREGGVRVSSAGNSWAVFVPIRVFASWETSLLQKGPLQIRLVWSETSGFWVISDAFCAGCRGIRGVVGLWAGVLASVVHGRRVGEGTAWGQWGRVRVFLDAGGGGGGGPPSSALRGTAPVGAAAARSHLWIGFRLDGRTAPRMAPPLLGSREAGTTVGGRGKRTLVVGRARHRTGGRGRVPPSISLSERRPYGSCLVGAMRVRGTWWGRLGYTTGLTPPSMFMAVPVMKLARSEARKVMRLAASSDSPTRPRGTFLPISA